MADSPLPATKLFMPTIQNPSGLPLVQESSMVVPSLEIPAFRLHLAKEKGLLTKMLFCTGGGIGDYFCAEPVFRMALNTFKGCEISLLSQLPDIFSHLPFKKIYDEKKGEKANFDDYFVFRSMPGHECLQAEFITHVWSHCVDYISLAMFKAQLPIKDKCITLFPSVSDFEVVRIINPETDIALHAGVTWQSRTFPKWWWDKVIKTILKDGKRPVLIGAKSAPDRGIVDVDTEGCLDLRERITLMQSVALLQKTKVLLTNDSCPIHMAASGKAWIGFVSTARHPDYITHARNGGIWGWRMQDHALGGMYQHYSFNPNQLNGISIDNCDPDLLLSWLPDPQKFGEWGLEKLHGL